MTTPDAKLTRRIVFWMFCLSAFTYIFNTFSVVNPNNITRVALSVSLIEDGSVCIDRYAHMTVDRAKRAGHFYCDKAPGLSIAAIPLIMPVYTAMQLFGDVDLSAADMPNKSNDVDSPRLARRPRTPLNAKAGIFYSTAILTGRHLSGYPREPFRFLIFIVSLVSSLSVAVAVCVMYLLLKTLGRSSRTALFTAILFGFGTPVVLWASAAFGHALAAACLFIGFAVCVWRLEMIRREENGSRDFGWWILAGFLLGYAVLSEYTCAPAAIIIGLMTLIVLYSHSRQRRLLPVVAGLLILGALPTAMLFFLNNQATAGSPLAMSYADVPTKDFPGMQTGFCGISLPRPHVMLSLLIGDNGLFWISPLLILFPVYVFAGWNERKLRPYLIASVLVALSFLMINSAYAYWDGGRSVGPRHLTPCMAFLVWPFAWAWQREVGMVRYMLFPLALCSIVISTLSAMQELQYPFYEIIAQNTLYRTWRLDFSNFLTRIGEPSYFSIVPLIVLWVVWVTRLLQLTKQDDTQKKEEPALGTHSSVRYCSCRRD